MNKYMSLLSLIILISITTSPADTLFTDHNYILNITKIADHPHVIFPNGAVPDSSFKMYDTVITYRIKFSETYDSVFIESLTRGQKEKVDSGKIYYRLMNGQFVVWKTDSTLHADLTKYGSGAPIIKVERGILMSNQTSSSRMVKPVSVTIAKKVSISKNASLLNGKIVQTTVGAVLKRKVNNVYCKPVGNEVKNVIDVQ